MRDFIVTFLVAFVLFKILRSFNFSGNKQSTKSSPDNRGDGKITINNKTVSQNKPDEKQGEYVPYEEIK